MDGPSPPTSPTSTRSKRSSSISIRAETFRSGIMKRSPSVKAKNLLKRVSSNPFHRDRHSLSPSPPPPMPVPLPRIHVVHKEPPTNGNAAPTRPLPPTPYEEEPEEYATLPPPGPVVGSVEKAMDIVASFFGGHDRMDHLIHDHVPALNLFVKESIISKLRITNRPFKFVICVAVLAILQLCLIRVPFLAYPLDAVGQVLYIMFTWFSSSQVQINPIAFHLTHIVMSASPHLIPYALLGNIYLPSIPVLLASFSFFFCERTSPCAPTLIEDYARPYIHPAAAAIRSIVDTKRIKKALRRVQRKTPLSIKNNVKVIFFFLFTFMSFHQTLARASLRLTWCIMALKTILVLDHLESRDDRANAYIQSSNMLRLWTWRLVAFAIEHIRVPYFGPIVGRLLACLGFYHGLATMFFLYYTFRYDLGDLQRIIQ